MLAGRRSENASSGPFQGGPAGLFAAALLLASFVVVLWPALTDADSFWHEAPAAGVRGNRSADVRMATYRVRGLGTSVARITYTNQAGELVQQREAVLPWTASFYGNPGIPVYLSAQNRETSGSLTAEFYADERLVHAATSYGKHCVATAEGTL